MMTTRVRTHDEKLSDFGGECLVACPRCAGCALVRMRGRDADPGCGIGRGTPSRRS